MRSGAQAGFGLLEALVALVLFSTVGLAMFSWINTNLDAAARLRERDQLQHAQGLANAWVRSLNPLQSPAGETELEPGLRLRWVARPSTALVGGAAFMGGVSSPFRLALYDVEMRLWSDRGLALTLNATRVGHERDPVEIPR